MIVRPAETENIVAEAADLGISRVWVQVGAASDTAVRFCEEHGISVVAGECILMFAEPVKSLHRMHRWIWKLTGRLPE